MNGGCVLGEELEYFLFGKAPLSIKVVDPNCAIAQAQRIIEEKVRKLLQTNSVQYLKDLQNYILDGITLSYIEFQNEKEGLKYFLNINSLSIQLTEMEIFLAFTSQIIAFTNTTYLTIDRVKDSLKIIDDRLTKVSADDLVYIFLNAYFKDDHNIGSLNDRNSKTGIGKWLTGYKMNLLSDPTQATEFIKALADYISDVDTISTYLIGTNSKTTSFKFIWFISVFNKLTKNKYLINILLNLFRNRHNYRTDSIYKNIKGTNVIDELKLDSFCKSAASVIVVDYFAGDISLLAKENKASIKLSERTTNKQNASLTIKNISYPNMWNLKYPRDKQSPKYPIPDNGDSIFFILALQEAYLNSIANPSYNGKIMNILAELLDPNQNYQIEHLITKDDFTKQVRHSAWKASGKFDTPEEYDEFRSRFENLSILDGPTNSSANSDTVAGKALKYKNARTIMNTNEPEYLVQSLIDGSLFYENNSLSELGERKIVINSNGITWEHSTNNRHFIEELTKKAVAELFK